MAKVHSDDLEIQRGKKKNFMEIIYCRRVPIQKMINSKICNYKFCNWVMHDIVS